MARLASALVLIAVGSVGSTEISGSTSPVCAAALSAACPRSTSEAQCQLCCGSHQRTLRSARCSATDCEAYCNAASGGGGKTLGCCGSMKKQCGFPFPPKAACLACIGKHNPTGCVGKRAEVICDRQSCDAPGPPPPGPPGPPPPSPAGGGKEFYVAARGGADSNSGAAFGSAFASLDHCLNAVATTGGRGTCYLSAGRHDAFQTTAIATSTVTISGAKAVGGTPAIIDGSVRLVPTWTSSTSTSSQPQCVWSSSPLSTPVSQLWVTSSGPNSYHGFDVLTPARFPNAKLSDDTVFHGQPTPNSSMLYSSRASTDGHLVDDGTHTPSLAGSGIDFTGTTAVLPLGTMGDMTQGVRVLHHYPGSSNFTYTAPPGTQGHGHTNNAYFFEGSCKLLDSEGEWCYDPVTKSVHVWLDGCADPRAANVSFRGRVLASDHLINATRVQGTPFGMKLEKVTLWGGTLAVAQTDLVLDTVELLFPTANRRVLGETGGLAADTYLGNNRAGGSIKMLNSTLEWADGTVPLNNIGDNAVFTNNLFRRNIYAIGDGASISDGGNSANLLFERNTLALFNAFSGITPALKTTITLNDFYGQGINADGALVHVHIKQQDGIIIYRNWAHDSTVKGFRFDRVNSKGATWGVNGTFVENVVWNCASPCFKGDHHNISRNTVMEVHGANDADGSKTPALYVLEYNPTVSWSKVGENVHTNLDANAADSIYNVSIKGVLTLPGIHHDNVAGVSIAPMLVDPANRNFRPKGGSAVHAKQAGAYSSDATATSYWIPGREEHTVSHPIPSHGGNTVCGTSGEGLELIWRGGYKASEHRLYAIVISAGDRSAFAANDGEAEGESVLARMMDTRVSTGAPDLVAPAGVTQHRLGGVVSGQRVLWRVDAVGEGGEPRVGPLWSFGC